MLTQAVMFKRLGDYSMHIKMSTSKEIIKKYNCTCQNRLIERKKPTTIGSQARTIKCICSVMETRDHSHSSLESRRREYGLMTRELRSKGCGSLRFTHSVPFVCTQHDYVRRNPVNENMMIRAAEERCIILESGMHSRQVNE